MLTRRAALGCFGAGVAASGLPLGAFAQAFPSRTITIVVPYPHGGPIDSLARLIAQEAGPDLKQSVVVENRPGASGIVGTGAVARAEPDGHTLILGTNQTHATNQSLIKSWPFDAVKDFTPVAGVAAMPHVLVVQKDFPANSLSAVVAMARAKPGALTFGSMGNGSGAHLAGELFKIRAGIDMLHVPYKGLAPMTTELLAGRVDLSIAPLPGLVAQQIASGSIRALGIASARRTPQLESVPTFAEGGVAGVEAAAWSALFAPAKTPPAVIEQLYQAVAAAMAKETVRQPPAPGPAGGFEDATGNVRDAAGRGGEMGRSRQARQCHGRLRNHAPSHVMPGFMPGTHVLLSPTKAWMAGQRRAKRRRPSDWLCLAMTNSEV